MNKHRSYNGKKINWLHYPTEINFFYLRLVTKESSVSVCFDIQHQSLEVREVFFDQILELKKIMEQIINHPLLIEKDYNEQNIQMLRLEWKYDHVFYKNSHDTEIIYDFFEKTLINFDKFYQEYKDLFIFLAK
ncbi:MAG: DUF4268 domain-containing protein [Flavobacteriia bacterium]|nr:DUF4268 domain-containing protein [Flavobacteriia bacterium]